MAGRCDVRDLQSQQVAFTQLAVDCEVEQGKITNSTCELQSGPDCPYRLVNARATTMALQWLSFQCTIGSPATGEVK